MKPNRENSENSLYIRVIGFALKYPKGFNYSDIIDSKELNLEPWENNIIGRNFEDALRRHNANNNTVGETIFMFVHGEQGIYQSKQNKFIVNFDAEFAFNDYRELKFARENAREARRLSLIAIMLSLMAIGVSAAIPFLVARSVTQNIMIDNNQLQEIKNIINQ